MLDEDQDVRNALRTELAERLRPPVHGGLAEVVSRGRRRRRTRQLGAALGVAAAITGSAVAAVAFGGSNAMPPAGPGPTVTSAPTEAAWPRADLPAQTPYGTWTPGNTAPPPVGRQIEQVPLCSIPDTSGRTVDTVRADADLRQRMTDAANAAAGGATVGVLVELHLRPHKPGDVDAYTYTADITDTGGTGSVMFSIGAFTGDPLAAADEQAFDEFNCDPPKRSVLADGTVTQIYAMYPSEPFQSLIQTLRIYRPDGTLYTVEVRNFGSPDFATNREQPEYPRRVGAGRPTLPLTEAQLADLGLAIAGG
jgi:hypothetical protein